MRRYGESKSHDKLKERIAQIVSTKGGQVYLDCYEFKCETAKGPRTYTPDVYWEIPDYQARSFAGSGLGGSVIQELAKRSTMEGGSIRIILEVQGSKGKGNHATKIHSGKDTNRIEDIRNNHGTDIHYVPLWDFVIRGSTDQEVWDEIEYLIEKRQIVPRK